MSALRVALATCFLVSLAGPASAVVFWEDGFENHLNDGSIASRDQTRWDTGGCGGGFYGGTPPYVDGCNASISTDFARSGSHSLKSHFTDPCGTDGNLPGCGTHHVRYHPTTNDIWYRWYFYTVNFQYGVNGRPNKMLIMGQEPNASGGGSIYIQFQGVNPNVQLRPQILNGIYSRTCPDGRVDKDCIYWQNVGSVTFTDNRWYCVEMHARQGDPGQYNGVLEVWVDGVQTVRYTDVWTRGDSGATGWMYINHYTQYGVGDRYMDDLAVGDTRIGCSGVVTPTPSAPASLNLQ